jgi:formate hydrogenlyase subunit 3/multisubunit Na+/H+ antiporter MnhD subunit
MITVLWLLPILAPLLGAGVALLPLENRRWLLAAAPLPALAIGLLGPPDPPPALPWVLLDARLGLDAVSRILLVMTAALWAAAGSSARTQAGDRGFSALFLLTGAGNIGLLLAADAATFYTLFALMTFAAYGLVVHDRTRPALRAGRVYLTLAVIGEVAIFSGMVLAVIAAGGSTDFADLRAAVAVAPHRDLIVALLVSGFGVKAGIVPVHLWLPLAHPAAPVPASAVLSGTMIKAGLVGWLRLLPIGEIALPAWSAALVTVGLASAFAGVAIGITQRDPKANLAYSSISQMGMIAVLVGVGLGDPDAAGLAVAAAAVYALHHGFAKGALFLGVGIAKAEPDPRRHRLVLAGMALAALSLAGLPLTSGALAKVALKDAIGVLPTGSASALSLALSLAAVGTTVLMGRLLFLLAPPAVPDPADRPPVLPWVGVLAAVVAATWVLPAAILPWAGPAAPTLGTLWDGLWPVLLGAAVVAGTWSTHRRRSLRLPEIPPGDAVVVLERGLRRLGILWVRRVSPAAETAAAITRRLRNAVYLAVQPGGGFDRVDRHLVRWRTAGLLLAAVGGLLATLLLAGRM